MIEEFFGLTRAQTWHGNGFGNMEFDQRSLLIGCLPRSLARLDVAT